jgi:membrane protein required for colicin V production
MAWPDLAIGFIVALGVWQGWRRGLISELTGTVAFAAAVAAAFLYPGMWDGFAQTLTHLGAGSAHVVAMLAYAAVAYAVVLAIGSALGAVAKLPIIGTLNRALGGIVGLVKAIVFVWVVLYVALFFPLSPDLRGDLHNSRLVALFEEPNASLDATVSASLPWFLRPYSDSIFARHRV